MTIPTLNGVYNNGTRHNQLAFTTDVIFHY